MALTLTSPAFSHDQSIPRKHTCDGPDLSPALAWSEPPAGTGSFALVMDDPDALGGTWVHWVLYDLPAATRQLPEGVPTRETLPDGSKQGANDFRRIGYGGPCPPPGKPHRYVCTLYALDKATGLPPHAAKGQLLKAIQGHILAEARLIGKYGR